MKFTILETGHIDGGAYRWLELADGSWRIEGWGPKGWAPGGASFREMMDSPPVGAKFAAELGIPLADITIPPRRLPTEYERDLNSGRTAREAFRELREEKEARDRSSTPFPTAPRLPTCAEMDDMCSRDLGDAARELNEKRGQSNPQSLTARQLREAIRLGVKLAEEEALFKLTMKAKQVAELDLRRPRLVWDRDRIEPRQA